MKISIFEGFLEYINIFKKIIIKKKMAGGKDDVKTMQTKRSFDSVPSTPGHKSLSPSKKQAKQSLEDQHGLSSEVFNALNSILDVKLEELTMHLSVMMDTQRRIQGRG